MPWLADLLPRRSLQDSTQSATADAASAWVAGQLRKTVGTALRALRQHAPRMTVSVGVAMFDTRASVEFQGRGGSMLPSC